MSYFGKAAEAADKFKALLNDIIIDTNPKQETLAYYGGVKQNTISQWLDPSQDRHLPAFQLQMLPKEFVLPVCKEIVKRFGMKIVEEEFNLPIDGRVEDNLLNIDVIQAEIIKLMDKDPKRAAKFCDALELQVKATRKELESKIK